MFNVLLVVFAFSVMGLLIYPLRGTKRLGLIIGIAILFVMACTYHQFGHYKVWQADVVKQEKTEQAHQALKSFKSKAEVIQALKARLTHTHQSAHGWYLLGRLYESQNQWHAASEAFHEAFQLAPEEQHYLVAYTITLWQLESQHMTPKIRALFYQILTQNPNQPDALMHLAMDAYKRKDNKVAKMYWTRLLSLVPAGSEEAKLINKAIANMSSV